MYRCLLYYQICEPYNSFTHKKPFLYRLFVPLNYPDIDPVHLHMLVDGNDQALAAVNDPGLYKVSGLRLHLNDHIRRLNGKPPCVGDIGSQKRSLLPGTLVIVLVEFFQLFVRHSAVLQKAADLLLAQFQGLRLVLELFQPVV